tara:strand:- start:108 stop:674 length:567 start_codon:yes stop_codon:yes gene_type:complete
MIKDRQKKQETGIVKKQDILEKEANIVYLSIGSNLGNKKTNIEQTKYLLTSNYNEILSVSSNYETLSWPNPKHPKFLNIIVKIKTTLNLNNLFIFIKNIEKKMGRKQKAKNLPRECDIDIIDFNQKNLITFVYNNKVVVPHPRMHTRNFVLFPLFELNSNWVHPKYRQKISFLINKLARKDIRSIKII